MLEKTPTSAPELPREELVRIYTLVRERAVESLLMRNENFPFAAGIEEAAYQKLKSESDEFPEYATHIDDLIRRFNSEGFIIVVTGGVNVFVMPAHCDSASAKDLEENTVPLKFFKVTEDMDADLKVLIQALRVLDQK